MNIIWYINGVQVQSSTNVIQSLYTNTSAGLGAWNVRAVATNANGADSKEWTWVVTSPITVTSPNGGESWKRSTLQTISWSYTGNPGAFVKIELLKGGAANRIITSFAPKGNGGSGSYKWFIPFNQITGVDYKIRITSTSNPAYSDTSDNNFAIS